jgi:ABC-2 type transport system permease protein
MSGVLAPATRAVLIYEFRMAARGRVLWLAVLPLLALAVLLALTSPRLRDAVSASAEVGTWALLVNAVTTVGLGVALADRFSRMRGLGLAELLDATPTSRAARMAGTLAGSLAAALVPAVALMVLVGAVVAVTRRDAGAVGWALIAVVTIILPGALLLATFAATAGLVLPLPVARVLTVLVWFWCTLVNQSLLPLPTATGTLFSPLGDYVSAGWLHTETLWAGRGHPDFLSPAASGGAAALNLILLLAVVAALFTGARLITARQR